MCDHTVIEDIWGAAIWEELDADTRDSSQRVAVHEVILVDLLGRHAICHNSHPDATDLSLDQTEESMLLLSLRYGWALDDVFDSKTVKPSSETVLGEPGNRSLRLLKPVWKPEWTQLRIYGNVPRHLAWLQQRLHPKNSKPSQFLVFENIASNHGFDIRWRYRLLKNLPGCS